MASESPQVRAVNLGGWLVVEGWMKPSLFDGIPNNDLLDGTQLQISLVKTGKYLSAENGGGGNIVADKDVASQKETFRLWRIDEKTFNFRVANRKFVGLSKTDNNTRIVAVEDEPEDTEKFEIHRNPNPNDKNHVKIKASNGFFLQVKSDKLITADYTEINYKNECGDDYDEWGYYNPSVFVLTVNTLFRGEYQIANGYGPVMAEEVMMKHWDTYIVEDDFKFIKKNGLNTVRIPVGWWTASDPNPPKPYIAGSLQFLDKAFDWADKHEIKVIVDLHAAPGSQSGQEPSSSRDGEQEWGSPQPQPTPQPQPSDGEQKWWSLQPQPTPQPQPSDGEQKWGSLQPPPTPQPQPSDGEQKWWSPQPQPRDGEQEWWGGILWRYIKLKNPTYCRDGFHEWAYDTDHIQKTVEIIEFFTERYAKRPSLFGVELLNEPRKPHVRLDVLIDYYERGYKAVRKHSKDAYVVMCDRLGPYGVQDPSELLDLAKRLPKSVIDVHYYNLFEPKFYNFTVHDNIIYTKRERESEIRKLGEAGALLFIGEWAAGMQVEGATKDDFKKFAETKMKVYDCATFGWGYWSLKNFYDIWSLEWMIKNGYIQIPKTN